MFGMWLVKQVGQDDQSSDVDRGRELLAQLRDQRLRNKDISHTPESQVEALQKENDELKLYLAAVLRLLVHKNVLTVEEIRQVVLALDSADGQVDGKMSGRLL